MQPGDIVVTGAGNLRTIRLFHVCIPPYDKNEPEPLVRMLILNLLEKSEEMQINTIAIPCLPKDIFGFTPEQCAFGYFSGIIDYLNSHLQTGFKEIRLICKNKKISGAFKQETNRKFEKKKKKVYSALERKKTQKSLETKLN